jgi:hypothetical protein
VANLAPSQRACQGPLQTQEEFEGVRAWLAPAAAPVLSVTVQDTHGRPLATGQLHTALGVAGPYVSRLDGSVAAGTRIEVCLRNRGPASVALFGSAPTPASGALRVGSETRPVAIALVFLRPRSQSLLSLVPTLFSRAALFKASWVGPWTFWVLCAAIVAAFALAARAVAAAVAADTDSTEAAATPKESETQRTSASTPRQ